MLAMSNISTKTRKVLWGKSAGRCAICKRKLIFDDDRHTNISNECHIISEKINGPRHIEGISDYDCYENLILLCRNHHAEVDSNVNKYTVDKLKEIKRAHEKYINERLMIRKKIPIVMTKFNNGRELGNILWGCHSCFIFNDNSNESLIALEDEFHDYILNLLNLQDDLSSSDKKDAYNDLEIFCKKVNAIDSSIYASTSQTIFNGIVTKCIIILLSGKHYSDIIVLERNKKSYEI